MICGFQETTLKEENLKFSDCFFAVQSLLRLDDSCYRLEIFLGNLDLSIFCKLACHSLTKQDLSWLLWDSRSAPPSGQCLYALNCPHGQGAVRSPARADWGRQLLWPWPVSWAHMLWHCIARAGATGPGSLCQLVPDLSVSQAHSHVCRGGRQRWHEVLIWLLAPPHPSEGVSHSGISYHSLVTAALLVPDVLFVILASLPKDRHW